MQLQCRFTFDNTVFNITADKDIADQYDTLHDQCQRVYKQLTEDHRARLVTWDLAIKDDQISLVKFNNCISASDPTNWAYSALAALMITIADNFLITQRINQLDIYYKICLPLRLGSYGYDFWVSSKFLYGQYQRVMDILEQQKMHDIARELYTDQVGINDTKLYRPWSSIHLKCSKSTPQRWLLFWGMHNTILNLQQPRASLISIWTEIFEFSYNYVGAGPYGGNYIIFTRSGKDYQRDFKDSVFDSVVSFLLEDLQETPKEHPKETLKGQQTKIDKIIKIVDLIHRITALRSIIVNQANDGGIFDDLILYLHQSLIQLN